MCADRRPNQYPTASPLPAHYPVPGGAQQQHYPSATHSNPLSGSASASGRTPPPANPWGLPDPQHASQHPPPRNPVAATPSTPPAPPASRPENMSSLTNYCVKVKDQFVLPPSASLNNSSTLLNRKQHPLGVPMHFPPWCMSFFQVGYCRWVKLYPQRHGKEHRSGENSSIRTDVHLARFDTQEAAY